MRYLSIISTFCFLCLEVAAASPSQAITSGAAPLLSITEDGAVVDGSEVPTTETPAIDSLRWYDLLDQETSVLQGRLDTLQDEADYSRIPTEWLRSKYGAERAVSSGLYVEFYSSSPRLVVEVAYKKVAAHLAQPKLQFDLYSVDCNGRTVFIPGTGYSFGTRSLRAEYNGLEYQNTHPYGNRYRLYLPAGVVLKSVRVGSDAGQHFEWVEPRLELPIVVSGTLTNVRPAPSDAVAPFIQKTLDIPTVDLTVSSPRVLDSVLIEHLAGANARLYVLSFTGKTSSETTVDEITSRIRQLRERTSTPILLVESMQTAEKASQIQREAFHQLVEAGVGGIYYQSDPLIVPDIVAVLDIKTDWVFAPITQARDMEMYNWEKRHNAVIRQNRTTDPEILVIGNSIMHYWSGTPSAIHHRGDEAWSSLFGDRRVTNMGFGWDRIENLNWRIVHGELDDCSPKHIFLKIGTNNISVSDPVSKIAKGIIETAELIRAKQPQAKLHFLTLTPRRDLEATVRGVNREVAELLKGKEGIDYINIYDILTLPSSGGKIDESLFTDGLHPNAEGYQRIADRIAEAIGDL